MHTHRRLMGGIIAAAALSSLSLAAAKEGGSSKAAAETAPASIDDLAIGDVVHLKSGGPAFLVGDLDTNPEAPMVGLFGWSDVHGFVQRQVPFAFLA